MRPLLLLILATTAIRLAFGLAIGLGVDESYMVSAGRTLTLGYFDHPPAAWWLSWASTHLLGTEATLAARLPFILLFALTTWLIARIGEDLAGPKAGYWAAATLNLSPVFGVTGGSWVLPDGPLDCALAGAALCLTRALPARDRAAWGYWCGAGLCAGLAMFSKYSAVLTIGGAFLFLLIDPTHRGWLSRPHPYAAAALAVLVFAPVIAWNATHDWASFAFQGARAGGFRFRPWLTLTTLAGEAAFILPWFWLPMIVLGVRALAPSSWPTLSSPWSGSSSSWPRLSSLWPRLSSSWPRLSSWWPRVSSSWPRFSSSWPGSTGPSGAVRPDAQAAGAPTQAAPPHRMARSNRAMTERGTARLLACLAAPPIVLFVLIAATSSQRVLFHWAAPGYLMLFPLLGTWVARDIGQASLRRAIAVTAALTLVAMGVVSAQTRLDLFGAFMPAKDPTAEGIDWTSLRDDLAARGLLPQGVVVGVPNWRDAGKIARALGPEIATICLNPDARNFGLATPASHWSGATVLILAVGANGTANPSLQTQFDRIEPLPPSTVTLRGRTVLQIAVARGIGLKPQAE